MERLFNQKEISRILSIPENRIRYWDRIGLINHIKKEKGQLFFDFKRLVASRTVKELLAKGISLNRIRKCAEKLKKILPDIDQPFSEIRIYVYGGQLVLCKDNMKFTPDGQLLIDFAPKKGTLIPLPADTVEDLFFQALELEKDGMAEEARRKYETILNIKPDHINSLVNMGNLLYHSGHQKEAEDYYRKALRINPDHAEANYNLANILEEKGDFDNAILFYRKAIHEDPEFTDAYFNLARVLEKVGDMNEARKNWFRYLELDPSSEWAQYVKKHLNEKWEIKEENI